MKKTYQTPHISVILVEDHAHVNMSTPYCAAKNNTTVGPNACAVAPGVPNLNVIQPTPPAAPTSKPSAPRYALDLQTAT